MAIATGFRFQNLRLGLPLATSFVFAGVIPDDAVPIEITNQVIVAAHPISLPPSFTHSGVIPDDQIPEGTRDVFLVAEPIPPTPSMVFSGVIPDDGYPPELTGLVFLPVAGHGPVDQLTHLGVPRPDIGFIDPEIEITRRVFLTAQPIPGVVSFTHSGVIPDDGYPVESTGRSILPVAGHGPVDQLLFSGVIPESLVNLEITRRVNLEAEPTEIAPSLVFSGVIPDDAYPVESTGRTILPVGGHGPVLQVTFSGVIPDDRPLDVGTVFKIILEAELPGVLEADLFTNTLEDTLG